MNERNIFAVRKSCFICVKATFRVATREILENFEKEKIFLKNFVKYFRTFVLRFYAFFMMAAVKRLLIQ